MADAVDVRGLPVRVGDSVAYASCDDLLCGRVVEVAPGKVAVRRSGAVRWVEAERVAVLGVPVSARGGRLCGVVFVGEGAEQLKQAGIPLSCVLEAGHYDDHANGAGLVWTSIWRIDYRTITLTGRSMMLEAFMDGRRMAEEFAAMLVEKRHGTPVRVVGPDGYTISGSELATIKDHR